MFYNTLFTVQVELVFLSLRSPGARKLMIKTMNYDFLHYTFVTVKVKRIFSTQKAHEKGFPTLILSRLRRISY